MPAATVWTEHLLERLAKLHADPGKSFRDIAEQLSHEFGVRLSKNACIGRARRLGLAQRPRSTPRPKPRKPQPVEPPAEVVPTVLPAWKVEPPVLTGRSRVTIYQLRRGVCHFPFGESGPPYAYCGNTTTRSSPWCPHHERVVYPRGHK